MVTAMYAAPEMAAWRRYGRVVTSVNRPVDLLRVNSALCSAFCRTVRHRESADGS